MWVEVVALLLLVAVAAELGWIIVQGDQRLKESQERLGAIERSLAEAGAALDLVHERVAELPQKFGEVLPRALPKAETREPAETRLQVLPPVNVAASSPPSGVDNSGLLQVLRDLSESLKGLRPTTPEPLPGEFVRRLEVFADKFAAESQKLGRHVASALESTVRERQQLISSLSAQNSAQQAEMSNLIAALKETLCREPAPPPPRRQRSRPGSPPTGDGAAPEATAERGAKGADAEPTAGGQAPAREPGGPMAVTAKGDRFAPLQNWVANNLDQIMNRSLNQWSRPEELLRDAPPELHYTARLLDPDCKLVLVGVEGADQYLALLLPGGQLGANYYDWFNSPTGGGVRVERTVEPAVLNAMKTGYSVLQRGTITYY